MENKLLEKRVEANCNQVSLHSRNYMQLLDEAVRQGGMCIYMYLYMRSAVISEACGRFNFFVIFIPLNR